MEIIDVLSKNYISEHKKYVDGFLNTMVFGSKVKVKKALGSKYLNTINFSDISTSWVVKDLLNQSGISNNLTQLSEKIKYLIFEVGDPLSVKHMLQSIVSGRIKTYKLCERRGKIGWYKTGHKNRRKATRVNEKNDDTTISGHFRAINRGGGVILTKDEIEYVKKFFKL